MMEFVIATNNQHKADEMERILAPLGITVVTAKDKGVDLSGVVEDGESFAQNARIKAEYAYAQCRCPVIADDSGLCVDALGGRPGVYTARYGGEDLPPADKMMLLLDELRGVPDEQRTAHFTCAVCCITDDGMIEVEGRCCGMIAHALSGEGGFGYDPIFMVDGVSFASLSSQEKDRISHRGKALLMLRDELLKKILTGGNYADK